MAQPSSFLLQIDEPERATAIRHALTAAGIPYSLESMPGAPHRVSFFVACERLEPARNLVLPYLDDDGVDDEPEHFDPTALSTTFPWGPIHSIMVVALTNVGIVAWSLGHPEWGSRLIEMGSLVPDLTWSEPWRFLSSVFLHSDLRHVGWNTLSLLIFGVPLMALLGPTRTWWIYFASGLGGGIAAIELARPGSLTLGSSGAVAGVFGAWVLLRLRQSRMEASSWRSRVRTLGIALLVLPTLVNPTSPDGHRISVSSHLGGLATGMLVGTVISAPMRIREPENRRTHPPPVLH